MVSDSRSNNVTGIGTEILKGIAMKDKKKNIITFFVLISVEIFFLLYKVVPIIAAYNVRVRCNTTDLITKQGEDSQLTIETPDINLSSWGIYAVSVVMDTNSKSIVSTVKPIDEKMQEFLSTFWEWESIQRKPRQYTYDVYVGSNDVTVRPTVVFYPKGEEEYLVVDSISMEFQKGHTLSFLITIWGTIILILDSIIWCTLFRNNETKRFLTENGGVICIATFTVAVASVPLFQKYIPNADDLTFHLMRIQGIADGLINGDFPVKVHPTWFNGWGHVIGVIYGQVMLYPFAVLRILGFPLGWAYKGYLVCLNILTFIMAYYASFKLLKDKLTAAMTAACYTLALYRVMDIYKRAAVGEASAMTFLPMVVLGFAALYDYIGEEEKRNAWIYLTVGATGIINSHPLTVIMIALFGVLFAVAHIKQTLNLDSIKQILKFVGVTFLVNAFYIVPLCDYLVRFKAKEDDIIYDMSGKALALQQVFSQAYNIAGYNGDHSPVGTMPFSIGVSALMVLFVFSFMICCYGWQRRRRLSITIAILFFVSVWMTTDMFPYAYLSVYHERIYYLLNRMEYPWRMLSISTILILCILIIDIRMVGDQYGKRIAIGFCALILSITCLQSKEMMDTIVHEKTGKVYYNGNDIDWSCDVALPDNTDVEQLYDTTVLTSDPKIVADDVYKKGTDVSLHVVNSLNDIGYVQVPLLCYPHFIAEDGHGKELEIVPGDYRKLCVAIPSGFNDRVRVFFREPWYWRMSELISFVTIMIILCGRSCMNISLKTRKRS